MTHIEFDAEKIIYRCGANCLREANAGCLEDEFGFCEPDCEDYKSRTGIDTEYKGRPCKLISNSCRFCAIIYKPMFIAGDYKKVEYEDDLLTINRQTYDLDDYVVNKLIIGDKTFIPSEEET
jgi:hypothetical protein